MGGNRWRCRRKTRRGGNGSRVLLVHSPLRHELQAAHARGHSAKHRPLLDTTTPKKALPHERDRAKIQTNRARTSWLTRGGLLPPNRTRTRASTRGGPPRLEPTASRACCAANNNRATQRDKSVFVCCVRVPC